MRQTTIALRSEWENALRERCYVKLTLALVACLLLTFGHPQAYAEEEPSVGDTWQEEGGSEAVLDGSTFLRTSYSGIVSSGDREWNSYQDPIAQEQPTSWISGPYFKSGLTFVLGKGLLAEQHKVGYSISGGVRQPVGQGLGNSQTFLDLGGSYLSAFGQTVRDVTGEEFAPGNPPVSLGPIDVRSTLTEVRRAGAHCGLGWYWGSPMDDRISDPQVRFATTLGGRLAHIRGRFLDEPMPIPVGANFFRTTYSKTDTVGGLYFNAQAILLRRNSALGHMQWTIDGEFAHDWVDFGGYEKRGLGTASILFGFLLSH